MSPWEAAGAAINAAFADPEPIIYLQSGLRLPPMPAIRSDGPAPDFSGAGHTLRQVSYEIQQALLPIRPVNGDTLIHRGRAWRVGDVTTLGDVSAWSVIVVDAGPAS